MAQSDFETLILSACRTPIGASGAGVLTTLVYALRARRLRYGVAALCIGGGMGIAMAVENIACGLRT